jgi:hypothetical protein
MAFLAMFAAGDKICFNVKQSSYGLRKRSMAITPVKLPGTLHLVRPRYTGRVHRYDRPQKPQSEPCARRARASTPWRLL